MTLAHRLQELTLLTTLFTLQTLIVSEVYAQQDGAKPPDGSDLIETTYEIGPDDYRALKRRAVELSQKDGALDPRLYSATLREGLQLLETVGRDGRRSQPFIAENLKVGTPQTGIDDDLGVLASLATRVERGIRGEPSTRVVGGEPVEAGQFTETVAIIDDNDQLCSGTVISETAVVTAAHCVCRMRLRPGDNGFAKVYFANPVAVSGGNSAPSAVIENNLTRLVDDRDLSDGDGGRDFCDKLSAGEFCGNDIAVVEFDPSSIVRWGRRPDYVKIADVATAPQGAELFEPQDLESFIVGHGLTEDTRRRPSFPARLLNNSSLPKQYATPSLPRPCGSVTWHSRCSPALRDWGCSVGNEFVLDSGGVDTCNGDSGGPVFRYTPAPHLPQLSQKQLLVGVTSRGSTENEICGRGGIYGAVFSPKATKLFDELLGR